MAMFTMIEAAWTGAGLLMPLKLIAAALFGKEALAGGVGVLLVGLMIHMMASVIWGVLFAALYPRRIAPRNALPIGVIYGVVLWAVMTFVALPVVNPVMRASVAMMAGGWFLAHVLFGLGGGFGLLIQRRWAQAT